MRSNNTIDRAIVWLVCGSDFRKRANPVKRVVLKSRYALILGKRAVLAVSSVVLFMALACCILCFIICMFGGLVVLPVEPGLSMPAVVGCLVSAIVAAIVWRSAWESWLKCNQQLDVLPRTRANLLNAAPADSLMRAVNDPNDESSTLLMRAVSENCAEEPQEELVRPIQ